MPCSFCLHTLFDFLFLFESLLSFLSACNTTLFISRRLREQHDIRVILRLPSHPFMFKHSQAAGVIRAKSGAFPRQPVPPRQTPTPTPTKVNKKTKKKNRATKSNQNATSPTALQPHPLAHILNHRLTRQGSLVTGPANSLSTTRMRDDRETVGDPRHSRRRSELAFSLSLFSLFTIHYSLISPQLTPCTSPPGLC